MSKYWGGLTSKTDSVSPVEADTFHELVTRYIDVPVPIRFTKAEFLSKSEDERNAIKAGPYLTACSFKPGTTRSNANAAQLVLAFFDLDDGKEVKRFCESPDALIEAIHPYSFAAYLTSNSTPEAPRMRVMVEVEPCDPVHHKPIIRHLADRLGLPEDFKGRRESNVLSQPMYRPNSFIGSDESPVVASRTDGIALRHEDVPVIVENDEFRYAYDGDMSDYSIAYLPIQDLTVEDVGEALNSIDPDCNYRVWTEICSGIRHQFRDEDQARQAFDVFDQWSSRGTKYKDGETRLKWRSFKPDAVNRAPITIRSLFKHAIDSGWNPVRVTEKVQATVEEWINATEDPNILRDEGCQRIAAVPIPNAILEDHLIAVLRNRLRQITGIAPEKKAIQRQLSTAKYHKLAEKRADNKPSWARPYVYVSTTNTFVNLATGIELTTEGFNNTFSEKLIGKDSEEEKTGRPAVLPVQYFLNQLRADRVDQTMYNPTKAGETIVKHEGRIYLNTYRHDSVPTLDETHSEAAGKMFLNHFGNLIGEPEYRDLIVDYLCHIVQYPGKKIRWCPLIQSAEGVGKGFLGKILMAVLGKRNVKVISPEVLCSQWNDYLGDSVCVILEEVYIPGHRKEEIVNSLKMAIADDYITINKRNTTARHIPNFVNLLAFTNYIDALHLKNTDRRWGIFNSPIQSEEQVLALNATGHFERMEVLLDAWSGALRHWMLNRKISPTFPVNGPAPKTRYRASVIEASKNPAQQTIEKLIEEDRTPGISTEFIAEDAIGMLERNSQHFLRVMGYMKVPGGYVHTHNWIDGLMTFEEHVEMRRKRIESDDEKI